MFFFLSLSENTLSSINDSFQVYDRYFGWITQLFKVLDLAHTVLTSFNLSKNQSQITRY